MAKKLSITFSDYVFEQYLQSGLLNRSKYIEEMFVKGVNSELGEYQGIQQKAIQALKQVREQNELISNLQKELALVKSKVITQEMRKKEREEEKKRKEFEGWREVEL